MKRGFLIFIIVLIASHISYAQKEKYESLFIYNFTKYIKWPDNYIHDKFVIGVMGNSAIYNSLESMATSKKKTGTGALLEVKKYNDVSEINDCHILFVSEDAIGKLSAIESKTAGKPILVITDSPGMATEGSVINFVEKDGKIKFELNEAKASSKNLQVSSSLSALAILI